MPLPTFSTVFLEESALSVLLVVALFIFALASFAFAYHWRRFGLQTPFFRKMNRLYFIVSGFLAVLSIVLLLIIVEIM